MQGELFFQGHSGMIYPSEKSLVVFFPRSWVIILLIQETNTKATLWWQELVLQRAGTAAVCRPRTSTGTFSDLDGGPERPVEQRVSKFRKSYFIFLLWRSFFFKCFRKDFLNCQGILVYRSIVGSLRASGNVHLCPVPIFRINYNPELFSLSQMFPLPWEVGGNDIRHRESTHIPGAFRTQLRKLCGLASM